MSWFAVGPEAVAAAANSLAGVGSTISAANVVAALQTAGVPAAAADQVSAAIAAFWGSHAHGYQNIGTQMSAFHDQFVQALSGSGAAYANAEAAAASPLQELLGVINAPTQQLLGRPLIGDGADGGTVGGVGQAGGAGGLLYGNCLLYTSPSPRD